VVAASDRARRTERAPQRERVRPSGRSRGEGPRDNFGTATGIRTPVPWLRNAAGDTTVSGCVGFPREFAPTVGPWWPVRARFVRKVSRIFQVDSWPCGAAASPVAGRSVRRLDRPSGRTRSPRRVTSPSGVASGDRESHGSSRPLECHVPSWEALRPMLAIANVAGAVDRGQPARRCRHRPLGSRGRKENAR
jgi:hypothetical protein